MVQVDKLALSKLNWRLPNSKSIYFNNSRLYKYFEQYLNCKRWLIQLHSVFCQQLGCASAHLDNRQSFPSSDDRRANQKKKKKTYKTKLMLAPHAELWEWDTKKEFSQSSVRRVHISLFFSFFIISPIFFNLLNGLCRRRGTAYSPMRAKSWSIYRNLTVPCIPARFPSESNNNLVEISSPRAYLFP